MLRNINELTWDLLTLICSDHELLEGLIKDIHTLTPFSDEMETRIIEFIDEAVQCHVIIPTGNYWDPKQIDWTGVQYGLLKAYGHVFDQFAFEDKLNTESQLHWKKKLR